MKKQLLTIAILCFFSCSAQVTQVWSDFNDFWTSSSTSINSVKPNTAHNLLAFRWNNGTVTRNYSTGVNNAKLTANSVSFETTKFRALPINEVPLTGESAYFIGLGALIDGLPTTVDNGPTIPFAPITTGIQKARYLTQGTQGLDLGSCLTNIPTTAAIRFNLSASGITATNINDGIPDVLLTQVAQPLGTNDTFRFVDVNGVTVGSTVTITLTDLTAFPVVGNWNPDFYNNDSTQFNAVSFVNQSRPMSFYAADVSAFGITTANRANAVALLYTPGGNSDPAFLAFNEPSLGISTKLGITAQPTTSACNGTMASSFTVRLEDRFGFVVQQAGIPVTASMFTGAGTLLGTTTVATNASGVATFSNLTFDIGGDHQIQFTNTSLDAVVTTNIVGATNCPDNIWTGDGANNNWNNTANWATALIPNSNNIVEIPTGRPRYPVLTANAGAKNLIMGVNTSINVNGFVFGITGDITATSTAKITALADGSTIHFFGTAAQTIPSGIINNGDLANLTIENTAGVTNSDVLKITQNLSVVSGAFASGNNVTMVCRFTPTRRTAQIGAIGTTGSITGNVTVEQCFPARRAFRFVTSSVTTSTSMRDNWQEGATQWNSNPNPGYGTHITGIGADGITPIVPNPASGLDWQPSGNSSLFTYNNATAAWTAVGSTTGTITAGVPYRMLIRGNRSTDIQLNASAPSNTILRTRGTILKGPVNVSSGLNATNNAWNLVGNPFQAQVDMTTVRNNSTRMQQFYYVWDPTLGGTPVVGQSGGRGSYVSIDLQNGTKSNASSAMTRFLQPYQAFFFQTASGGAPTIVFNEAAKTVGETQTNVFRTASTNNEIGDQIQTIELVLFDTPAFNNNDTSRDGLTITFSSGYNNNFDSNDAIKFPNSDESISRKIGQNLVSIENRDTPQSGTILPLNITQYRTTNYTMTFRTSPFATKSVYLKDYFTNQNTLLTNGQTTAYNFTVDSANLASVNPERFAIEILESALSVKDNAFGNDITLYPNPANGSSIFLNFKATFKNAKIEIFNLLGQKVKQLDADLGKNSQINIPISDVNTGAYVISVTTDSGEKFTSKFIRN